MEKKLVLLMKTLLIHIINLLRKALKNQKILGYLMKFILAIKKILYISMIILYY